MVQIENAMRFVHQKMKLSALLLAGLFLFVAVASGHHGTPGYDMEKEVQTSGIVKEWDWGYPHTLLIIAVADPQGKSEEWILEGGPPGLMAQAGWSKDSLRAGEKVTVKLHSRRKGPKGGLLIQAKRANGQVLTSSKPPE